MVWRVSLPPVLSLQDLRIRGEHPNRYNSYPLTKESGERGRTGRKNQLTLSLSSVELNAVTASAKLTGLPKSLILKAFQEWHLAELDLSKWENHPPIVKTFLEESKLRAQENHLRRLRRIATKRQRAVRWSADFYMTAPELLTPAMRSYLEAEDKFLKEWGEKPLNEEKMRNLRASVAE